MPQPLLRPVAVRVLNAPYAYLDSLHFTHLGTYVDSASRLKPTRLSCIRTCFRLALLNYTYGTNGIAIPKPTIVNMIDTTQMKLDLKRATDSVPDKTIVFVHWGDEYQSHPNQFQQDIATFLFQHGADIIIGMHPHVIQRMERTHFPDSNGVRCLLPTLWAIISPISATV